MGPTSRFNYDCAVAIDNDADYKLATAKHNEGETKTTVNMNDD